MPAHGTPTSDHPNSDVRVDLAADLTFALQLRPSEVWLDPPGILATTSTGISGLSDLATVEQALGFLIGRGTDPDLAHAHLIREAGRRRMSVVGYSRQMVVPP